MGLFGQTKEEREYQIENLHFLGFSEPVDIESAAFGIGIVKAQIVSCDDCGSTVIVKPLEGGQDIEDHPVGKHMRYCQAITQEDRYVRLGIRQAEAAAHEQEGD
jgi:hypothetical protein